MSLFRNVVFAAALSGLLAGLVLAALQSFATVPLILEAEAFESAGLQAHDHGSGDAPHDHASAAPHDHGEGAWAPADGLERLGWSVAFNAVSGVGFALVLMAASELAGARCCDLFSWCRDEFQRLGLAFTMPHIGHSMGVDLHEHPILNPQTTDELVPGMIVNVEPIALDRPDGAGYHIEDLVLVTEGEPEVLTAPWPPGELRLIGALQ